MDRKRLVEISNKLYGIAESIQQEYGLTTAEIKEVLEAVIEGF